jgi:hypothetical protein
MAISDIGRFAMQERMLLFHSTAHIVTGRQQDTVFLGHAMVKQMVAEPQVSVVPGLLHATKSFKARRCLQFLPPKMNEGQLHCQVDKLTSHSVPG